MSECKLCGRNLINKNDNYGSTCIKKCYSLLGISSVNVKNKDKEAYLANRIMLLNRKVLLSRTKRVALMDRYLASKFLEEVDLEYYQDIKNKISNDIKSISTFNNNTELTSISLRLSDAYEIYKVYDKYKMLFYKTIEDILKSKTFQNLLWNGINFGVKKYYNDKKYLTGITKELQILMWKVGVVALDKSNNKVSAFFLNHAIEENPEKLFITDGFIADNIKNDKNFIEQINTIINEHERKQSKEIEKESYLIRFSSGDLALSFHDVTIVITGKEENGIWKLNIYLEDVYDFTDFKELEEYIDEDKTGMIASIANNTAMLSTSSGVLHTYDIVASFPYEVKRNGR